MREDPMNEKKEEKEQSEYIEDETSVYEVDLECLKGRCAPGEQQND